METGSISTDQRFGPFDLSDIETQSEPFPFFGKEQALNPEIGALLLDWFEKAPHWKPHAGGFYELNDFSVLRARTLPPALECIRHEQTLAWLRRRVQVAFDREFEERIKVDGFQMLPNDKVGIHTDYRPGEETHRLIFYLTRSWQPADGGVLLFFKEPSLEALSIGFPPKNLLAIAFEISQRSHHAISPVKSGARYSLIYSFYARP